VKPWKERGPKKKKRRGKRERSRSHISRPRGGRGGGGGETAGGLYQITGKEREGEKKKNKKNFFGKFEGRKKRGTENVIDTPVCWKGKKGEALNKRVQGGKRPKITLRKQTVMYAEEE